MSKGTPVYTVGNIIAIIAVMLVAVAIALHAFLGEPLRGTPVGIGTLFTIFALYLGMHVIKGIRSRRR